jgi:serine phosphatase RsbU (regulator of sigma subunit)
VERPDGTQVWVETTSTLVRDRAGRPMGGLTVMADITQRKLTEIEAERVRQREHAIATTLQAALRPRLPERVPGLDLKDFYRPALEEANVGGDFFDVFPLDKGLFVLAVGDVSGKGLAAAAQVATVRNMLRYALYQRPTVAQAVTELNQTVSTQELLTGFVTLFVGVYDTHTYEFTYASCGHEPGLVHRADGGTVEEMPPTGPVLGASEQAVFEQRVVAFSPGDSFVIYTDGISEAGRNRRDFWGVDGLTSLLQTEPPSGTADALADRVIAGAVAHAQGALHDDVCLLAGIVQANGGWPTGAQP